MEKVVYILGAGFSAPLGLPVISNFRFKSQDMFLHDSERYGYFKEVFDAIDHMAKIKNYYETDLFNIEEILSILEMGEFLQGKRLKEEFIKYLKDVISFYTPDVRSYPDPLPGNWNAILFGATDKANYTWKQIGYFIASILNVRFIREHVNGDSKDILCVKNAEPSALYSIITLNYDIIPETVAAFLNNQYETLNETIAFASPSQYKSPPVFERDGPVWLAKLHGSLDSGIIVPPTWSKGVTTEIVPAWRLAHQLLSEATHLRIIGFSLPIADAYLKYLIKSAAMQNSILKEIDVICLDEDGSVRQRYNDFIKFRPFRFVNANTTAYLEQNLSQYGGDVQNGIGISVSIDKLEDAHEWFMMTKK